MHFVCSLQRLRPASNMPADLGRVFPGLTLDPFDASLISSSMVGRPECAPLQAAAGRHSRKLRQGHLAKESNHHGDSDDESSDR